MKARYHIPAHAAWNVEPPSEERTRLERTIIVAIEGAVKSKAHQGSEIITSEIKRTGSAHDIVLLSQINCHIPIKLRITGRVSDTQLDELGETLMRGLAKRIAFAERTISAHHGRPLGGDFELLREGYDPAREDVATEGYYVPSYDAQGQRRSIPVRRQTRGKPWFIRKAINFHAYVGQFLDLLENASAQPLGVEVYADLYPEQRWVSLWLVQVNQPLLRSELKRVLIDRAFQLSRVRSNHILFHLFSPPGDEKMRQLLIEIDQDHLVAREIPNLARQTGLLTPGEDVRRQPAAWLLFASMVLPEIKLQDRADLGAEIQVPVRLGDLTFLVNPVSTFDRFERRFALSWEDYLREFGDKPATVRFQPITVQKRTDFLTLETLVEQAVRQRIGSELASGPEIIWYGDLYVLSSATLEQWPLAVRDRANGITNEVTRRLDKTQEAMTGSTLEPKWKAAYVYTVFTISQQSIDTARYRREAARADSAEEFLDRYRVGTFWNIEKAAKGLAAHLAQNKSAYAFVRAVFDKIPLEYEDDLGADFIELQSDKLDEYAATFEGRAMLDVIYQAIITGKVTSFQRKQSQRILEANKGRLPIAQYSAQSERKMIFPVRNIGATRQATATFRAKLLPNGKIHVRYTSVRLYQFDMFKEDRETLPPYRTTMDGFELDPDQIVGVRLHDEGGDLVEVPALALIDFSNQIQEKTISTAATAFFSGLTLGAGALGSAGVRALSARVAAGEASKASLWGARALLWADRIAWAIPAGSMVINEHRDWIVKTFPNTGPALLDALDKANRIAGYYGWGRLGVEGVRFVSSKVRPAWQAWKAEATKRTGMSLSDQKLIKGIDDEAESLLYELELAEEQAKAKAPSAVKTEKSTVTHQVDDPAVAKGSVKSDTAKVETSGGKTTTAKGYEQAEVPTATVSAKSDASKGKKGGEKKRTAKPEKEPDFEPVSAKDKRKQRQEAAKKQKQARDEADAEQRYAEEERADKGKGEAKQRAKDRPGKQQKALAPPASDLAFRQRVDEAVKRDLNRTGRYDGLETWQLEALEGPINFATADALLKPGRGVRYQARYRRSDGSTIDVSVNYDPVDDHFGTIKESSGS